MSDIIYRGLTAEDLDELIVFAHDYDFYLHTEDTEESEEMEARVYSAFQQIDAED